VIGLPAARLRLASLHGLKSLMKLCSAQPFSPKSAQPLPRHQRGIGIVGILFVLVVLAFAGVVGMQAAPTVLEYTKIKKAAEKASNEADVQAVRASFEKSVLIDDIKSISSKDLKIDKANRAAAHERFTVSFAYDKEIPIYGPVFLLIKYSGSTK
jgi:hypothetical protein